MNLYRSISNRIDRIYGLHGSARFASIEGLRAWAIIMVFNVHFFARYYDKSYFFSPGGIGEGITKVFHAGHIGVDLFFVISGFLIFRSLRKNSPSSPTYFNNRFRRLMPAHFFILILASYSMFNISDFLLNLFFLPKFIEGSRNYNNVTWSLGWEWMFYILIFFIYHLSNRGDFNLALRNSIVFAAFLLTLQWLFYSNIKEEFRIVLPDAGRFLGFFIGVFISQIELDKKSFIVNYESTIKVAAIFSLFGILLMQILWSHQATEIQKYTITRNLYYLTVSILFAIILLRLINYKGTLNRIFEWRPLRIIGQVSYSFYLLHVIIGIPIALKLVPEVVTVPKMALHYAISFIATFLLATLVYFFLEKPYFRKKGSSKSAK